MRLIKGKTYYKKPWYQSWRAMMERCYRKKSNNYSFYGGRGIKVCDEWHNIEEFEKWVEASNYRKGLTLERIDVNGNYEPSNCTWATKKQQANNRRNTKYIEYKGKKYSVTEFAEKLGLKRSTVNNRVWRGWSVEKIINGGYVHGSFD